MKTIPYFNSREELTSRSSEVEKCRVAHLHSTLGIYGAERWTFALLRYLDKDEFDSIVISFGTKPGADLFYQMALAKGMMAIHIPISGKFNPKIIARLRSVLIKSGVKILHTHGFKADVLGYIATRRLSIRIVSTIHGWSADEGLKIRLYEAISRLFLKKFDRVYPLSLPLYDNLISHNFDSKRLKLIVNGVDFSEIEFKNKKNKHGQPFLILFAGRLCRPKGVFDLISAFSMLHDLFAMKLIFVGDGPARQEMVAMVSSLGLRDQVQFVGSLASIVSHLHKCDVLVLPSYSEGIPRIIMEAFAAGIPVIGTSIPGILQLVEHELSGLLVPVGNVESLASAILRIRNNPQFASLLAIEARKLVIDKFSAQRLANDYKEEYKYLCQNL